MQQNGDNQIGFEDWALAQRTRPNEVLEKIATLVDFSEAERQLEATYSEVGRPGHRAGILLRVMLLQHLYGLSDPQAEAQLGDRLSFQKFVGLRADETVPDESTICRFRQRMIAAGLHERLLAMLNEQLAAAGYLVKRTMLVDATLVESSRTRPAAEAARTGNAPDRDARYNKKYGKSYYGYKAHVSADGDNQLVCRALLTPANVDDSAVFGELIEGKTARRLRRPDLRQPSQQGLFGPSRQRQRHHEKGRPSHHRHRRGPGAQPAQKPAPTQH